MHCSQRDNKPMSSFWVEVRAHCPVKGGCVWSWKFVVKRLLVSGGVAGVGEFYGDLVVILSGASEKHSR